MHLREKAAVISLPRGAAVKVISHDEFTASVSRIESSGSNIRASMWQRARRKTPLDLGTWVPEDIKTVDLVVGGFDEEDDCESDDSPIPYDLDGSDSDRDNDAIVNQRSATWQIKCPSTDRTGTLNSTTAAIDSDKELLKEIYIQEIKDVEDNYKKTFGLKRPAMVTRTDLLNAALPKYLHVRLLDYVNENAESKGVRSVTAAEFSIFLRTLLLCSISGESYQRTKTVASLFGGSIERSLGIERRGLQALGDDRFTEIVSCFQGRVDRSHISRTRSRSEQLVTVLENDFKSNMAALFSSTHGVITVDDDKLHIKRQILQTLGFAIPFCGDSTPTAVIHMAGSRFLGTFLSFRAQRVDDSVSAVIEHLLKQLPNGAMVAADRGYSEWTAVHKIVEMGFPFIGTVKTARTPFNIGGKTSSRSPEDPLPTIVEQVKHGEVTSVAIPSNESTASYTISADGRVCPPGGKRAYDVAVCTCIGSGSTKSLVSVAVVGEPMLRKRVNEYTVRRTGNKDRRARVIHGFPPETDPSVVDKAQGMMEHCTEPTDEQGTRLWHLLRRFVATGTTAHAIFSKDIGTIAQAYPAARSIVDLLYARAPAADQTSDEEANLAGGHAGSAVEHNAEDIAEKSGVHQGVPAQEETVESKELMQLRSELAVGPARIRASRLKEIGAMVGLRRVTGIAKPDLYKSITDRLDREGAVAISGDIVPRRRGRPRKVSPGAETVLGRALQRWLLKPLEGEEKKELRIGRENEARMRAAAPSVVACANRPFARLNSLVKEDAEVSMTYLRTCGLFQNKKYPVIAASPDAIARLRISENGHAVDVPATVELKTCTSMSSQAAKKYANAMSFINGVRSAANACEAGVFAVLRIPGRQAPEFKDAVTTFKAVVPDISHRSQILHQCAALGYHHALYLVGTQQDILYAVLVEFDTSLVEAYRSLIVEIFKKHLPFCKIEKDQEPKPPTKDVVAGLKTKVEWGRAGNLSSLTRLWALRMALDRFLRKHEERDAPLSGVVYVKALFVGLWNLVKSTIDKWSEIVNGTKIPQRGDDAIFFIVRRFLLVSFGWLVW